jgi:3-hydroxyacyl-CoA dehydrogenase, NAD binding domain
MRRWAPPLATSDRPLTIIGTDDKARRAACLWASAGHGVDLQDPDHGRCEAALRYIHANASNFAKLLGRKSFQVEKCQIFTDLTAAVKDTWLVIEVFQRVRHPVADLLGQIDSISPSDCILVSASSSSSSSVSSSSSSNLTFNKIDIKRRNRSCCLNYSFLPRNCLVELLPD